MWGILIYLIFQNGLKNQRGLPPVNLGKTMISIRLIKQSLLEAKSALLTHRQEF